MAPDADARSPTRLLARLSIAAALLSCTLNCVFSQLAARFETATATYGWLVDWSSLVVVLAGIVLGAIGLAGGLRKRSPDTAMIATIGLVLNLGIIFVIVWYFAFVRPGGRD
jgi:ABC-type transport system involved in multi-copper enzyme maturation permease subunit